MIMGGDSQPHMHAKTDDTIPSSVVMHIWGPARGGGGLVLCDMRKIHLLAMCYVNFCSHCYVKLK